MKLRDKVIRVAYSDQKLRPHLLPLLVKHASKYKYSPRPYQKYLRILKGLLEEAKAGNEAIPDPLDRALRFEEAASKKMKVPYLQDGKRKYGGFLSLVVAYKLNHPDSGMQLEPYEPFYNVHFWIKFPTGSSQTHVVHWELETVAKTLAKIETGLNDPTQDKKGRFSLAYGALDEIEREVKSYY